MDSDDELMMMQLMQEESDALADEMERIMIIGGLLHLCAQLRDSGSMPGKKRNRDRQRLADAVMLETDYFQDDPTHGPLVFRRRFE